MIYDIVAIILCIVFVFALIVDTVNTFFYKMEEE